MSYIYYNPEVMDNPGTILTHIHEVDMSDRLLTLKLRLREPYATRKEAVAEDSSRSLYFYEDGVLYSASRIGAWQWKPCADVECEPGINWDTYVAKTPERLHEYLCKKYNSICYFKPRLNPYGLYEIQVHYDGICR